MEVLRVRKQKNREAIVFVRVTTAEAMDLIVSLAEQIRNGSPNNGRIEFWTVKRESFSIAVIPPDTAANKEEHDERRKIFSRA
jgi:hypothetical protein